MSASVAFADASKPLFDGITPKYIEALNHFAAAGYPFNNQYTLYKLSQREAFQGYVEGLKAGQTHGYIELPTGVGKTALFIALIKNYLAAVNGGKNAPRVLIAVPTDKLAVQTAKSFAKFMPEIAPVLETDDDEGREIDWEKSDIGLQYSKRKDAHKKPKVLITTYQSLAKDKANKTYDPAEYGFVIYDEGHVITAPIFGRATDKFAQSIQLAVSATPEYAPTKKVAQRLPHLYYQLPLAEAINRGDLCNVRPALLKTGYTIDIRLFEELMEKQSNTPLNGSQLEMLLNQESRNKAVVETYLRGIDPDTGERYLGQNAMVFGTATKHADDIVTQFNRALTEGDGVQIAEWLDQEGLELIAAVHGKVKGQYLRPGMLPHKHLGDREFSRGKEFYTEEEIFDLHERGKILLLSSVAKLKWGFDSPRDTLLFDLADRFSKVDATQIDGRAFRLDDNDPNKTATVFNLIDENTQELYDKHPKLIPIYCAEVIEGAKFRPPARRTRAVVNYREPPPGLTKSLEESGFDVLTDIDAVRMISLRNKSSRAAANFKYPDKPDGWKTAVDLNNDGIYINSTEYFNKVFKDYIESKIAELIKVDGLDRQAAQIRVDSAWVGVKTSNDRNQALAASPAAISEMLELNLLRTKIERAPKIPTNWKTANDLDSNRLYVGGWRKIYNVFEEFINYKIADLIKDGIDPEEARQIVSEHWIGKKTPKYGAETLAASPEAVAAIVALGLLIKSEDKKKYDIKGEWKSAADIKRSGMYMRNDTPISAKFQEYAEWKIKQLTNQQRLSLEEAKLELNTHWIGMRKPKTGREGIAASPNAIDEMLKNGILKRKDSSIRTGETISSSPQISPGGVT